MELRGDEKRIRALFFELSFDDQGHAPVFDHLWTRAESGRLPRTRVLNAPVAVIVIALIAVAFLFGIWWRSKPGQSRSQQTVQIASQETHELQLPSTHVAVKPVSILAPKKTRPPRQNTLPRHRQTERALTHEAAMLSSWQSPTEIFMQTSASFVLKSLPQLNQSAKELELFLPKNIETTKESNQ
jgi:hypothetical protein